MGPPPFDALDNLAQVLLFHRSMTRFRPHFLSVTLLLAALVLPSTGQEAKVPDSLATLKTQYEKALERTTKPLRDQYRAELRKLLDQYTRAGRLDEANAVERELKALDQKPAEAGKEKSGPEDIRLAGQWEYKQDGVTYRRELLPDGTARIWKEGRIWLNDEGKPYWAGHRWRYDRREKVLVIENGEGKVSATYPVERPSADELKEKDESRVIVRIKESDWWREDKPAGPKAE